VIRPEPDLQPPPFGIGEVFPSQTQSFQIDDQRPGPAGGDEIVGERPKQSRDRLIGPRRELQRKRLIELNADNGQRRPDGGTEAVWFAFVGPASRSASDRRHQRDCS